MADEFEWRMALKVGDEVTLVSYGKPHISRVTKVTATRVAIGSTQFNRKTGYQIGERYSTVSLEPVTQAHRDGVEHRKLTSMVYDFYRNAGVNAMTLDQLRAMLEIIKGVKKEVDGAVKS